MTIIMTIIYLFIVTSFKDKHMKPCWCCIMKEKAFQLDKDMIYESWTNTMEVR